MKTSSHSARALSRHLAVPIWSHVRAYSTRVPKSAWWRMPEPSSSIAYRNMAARSSSAARLFFGAPGRFAAWRITAAERNMASSCSGAPGKFSTMRLSRSSAPLNAPKRS